MKKEILKPMKEKQEKRTAQFFIAGLILLQAARETAAYAAGGVSTGVPELDVAIKGITTILAGVVTGYGIMKLINGVKAWSDANEEMDAARKSQGMQTIISGAICVMVLPILKILGFTL